MLLLFVSLLSTGCITAPYRPGVNADYQPSAKLLAINQPQIERGEDFPILDGIG